MMGCLQSGSRCGAGPIVTLVNGFVRKRTDQTQQKSGKLPQGSGQMTTPARANPG